MLGIRIAHEISDESEDAVREGVDPGENRERAKWAFERGLRGDTKSGSPDETSRAPRPIASD
jgi:hypothetical protein